ncbi:hypothetical protein EVAR_91905_1 [Eumeta japonica]|uniref:Uncharacterized protein n=1 Tax=Eumeta variegata TaxID=151549 RepID=A0A4C1T1D3_EUMVA|nr:hypothetical protein EVAR_91905_1 [Eumeta japonica]
MSFSSTLLHARNLGRFEISELLTAKDGHHRLNVVSNDVVPAVAEAGSDTGGSRRTASPDGPGRPSVAAWAGLPRVGDGARGGSRGLVCFPRSGSYLESRGGATGLLLGLLGLGLL